MRKCENFLHTAGGQHKAMDVFNTALNLTANHLRTQMHMTDILESQNQQSQDQVLQLLHTVCYTRIYQSVGVQVAVRDL